MPLSRYVFPILLVVFLSVHATHVSGDPLLKQFMRADSLAEETSRIDRLFGRLISGETEISTEKIAAMVPILQMYADSTPSNPFLTFALGSAYWIVGQEDMSESLFTLANERAADDAGLLLVLASKYRESGRTKHEDAVYDALLDLSISSAYTSRPAVGYYFYRRGLERLKEGKRPEAFLELERALKFDPSSLPANLLATSLSTRSFKGKAVGHVLELYRALRASFFSQQLILLNVSRGATVCLIIVAVAFFLGIAFRNLPSIQHRVYEFLPSKLAHAHKGTLAWAIVAIPVVWLWSVFPLVVIPIYLFGAWLPATRKERFLIFMLFVYLLLVPFLVKTESRLLQPLDPGHKVSMLAKAQVSGYEPSLAAEIQAYLMKDPSDFDMTFSLGLLQKRGGNFEEAISLFNAASDMKPRLSSVRNNLGNTYFASKDYDRAMEEYTTAARLDPGSAAPHYNMAQIYSRKLMLREQSEELNRALELDYGLVSRFRRIEGENYNRQVIDITIPPSRIWQILLRSKLQGQDSAIVGGLFGAYPTLLSYAAAVLLFLSIVVGTRLKNVSFRTTCVVCGTQGCQRCLEDNVCPRCTKKMVVTESSSMKERLQNKLRDRAYKYRAIKSLALTVLLPGAGHVFLGFSWKGILYSLMYSIVFINISSRVLFLRISPFSQAAAGSAQGIIASVAMAVIYLFCIRSIMKTLTMEEL